MKTFSKCLIMSLALLSTQARSTLTEDMDKEKAKTEAEQESETRQEREAAEIQEDFEIQPINLEELVPDFHSRSQLQQEGLIRAHRGGNGGNSIAAQFAGIASNAAQIWNAICQESNVALCDSLSDYKALLNNQRPEFVTVLSSPMVYADDGREREAVNLQRKDGKSVIVVGEQKWREIDSDYYDKTSRKINLVLHEYLSILGLDSSDYYGVSKDLYDLMEDRGFDTEKVASHSSLGDACSVAVVENNKIPTSTTREIKSKLNQLGYNTDAGASPRYSLTLSQHCSGFLVTNCAVYAEMEDSFKVESMKVAFSLHEDSRSFSKEESVNKSLSKIFKNFPACRL